MASYLLLRNNKESGPFNLNDLLTFGLKPYDLVWIEGKSAAWRYPSEIEELKSYAPAVEEQPFDRFFKKPSATQAQEPVIPVTAQPAAIKENPVVEDIKQQEKAIEEKYEKYIPKKSVFVTMPGQSKQPVYTGLSSQHAGQTGHKQPVQQAQPTSKYQPVPEPEPAPTITVTENPEAAKIKFSQPLDEIKEMYVKALQDRKHKLSKKNFLLANLKKAAVIIGLVTLGILAGLAIKSESDSDLAINTIPGSAPVTTAVPNSLANNDPINEPTIEEHNSPAATPSVNSALEDDPQPLSPQVKQQMEQRLERETLTAPRTKKEQASAPATGRQSRYEDPQASMEKDPVTGERSKRTRTANDIVAEPDSYRDKPAAKAVMGSRKSGLESLVSVSSNDYKRVAFGGIRNLELTVTNDSKFVLDKVTVQLQYLKPSEEPLKTEFIQFHSVSPNGSMTMRIKDTNRGIKVAYKIIDIQSQQTETALRE